MAPFFIAPILVLLSFALPTLQYMQYDLTRNISNTGPSLNLDNGLHGRSTGFVGNITTEEGNGYVQHGLFFVTKDGSGYSLSVLAYDLTNGDSYSAEVIWEANQSRLVSDGAVLEFINGNMLLQDSDGEIVWQTGTQNRGVKYLQVSNRGNIVLVNDSGNIHNKIWQTFDSPTDTMVCTQVLKPGMHLYSGNYSLVLEQDRLALLYRSSITTQEWTWNDALKSSVFLAFCCDASDLVLQLRSDLQSVNEFNKFNTTNCTNSSDTAVVNNILKFKSSNEFSFAAFVRLEDDGQITATKWVIRKQQFDNCDLLTSCGSYGLCSQTGCSCPSSNYFLLSVTSNPEAGCQLKSKAYTRGCNRASLTDTLKNIDYLPNSYSSYQNLSSVDDCRNLCLLNASCLAGFYQAHTRHCFQVSQVETLRSANSSYMAFFKYCTDSSSRKNKKVAIIIGVCVGLVVLGIATGVIIFIICRRRIYYDGGEESDGMLDSFLSETTLKRFRYKELEEITNGFCELLGKGGFGSVYKGILPNGSLVAVKKLESSGQSTKEFYAEMSILSRVHHMNLVQLIGFCANRSRRALIYEYMHNGSLDKWLHANQLDWKTRLNIAKGAARGMAYLHEECNERIIHLDVKPQNILLDENFYPKVGDFGLSRLMDKDQSFVMTTVRGTRGYLAPEWFTESAINEKSDVYSFGVVLLELVGGSKHSELQAKDLWEYSQSQEGISEILNKNIGGSMDLESGKLILKVAALCLQQEPSARPAMSRIVEMLEGKVELPSLKYDGFHPNISLDTKEKFVELLESKIKINSSDFASLSMLYPR